MARLRHGSYTGDKKWLLDVDLDDDDHFVQDAGECEGEDPTIITADEPEGVFNVV